MSNLIDVLKAERNILANEILNKEKSGYSSQLELDPMRKRLANLNAHIARLESPELVEVVKLEVYRGITDDDTWDSEDEITVNNKEVAENMAKIAIDAVLGRV